jgi:hypothetical protein
MMRYIAAVVFAGLAGLATPTQSSQASQASQVSQACKHGPSETAAEASRREAAVRFARDVNTTEAAAHARGTTYYELDDLHTLPPAPAGFTAHLASDGSSYGFSLRDTTDACRFALFSDEEGVIYSGTPIR